MLVALHAGNAFWADSTAARSSSSVLWGTLVTRLLVAGSCRSIHSVALDGTNSLSMKFVVSMGLAMGSWVVGYSVAVEAALVVPAGLRCLAVACSLRVATRGVDVRRVEDDRSWADNAAGDLDEIVEREREAAVAADVALAAVMRGEAWRAGRERAIDRRAAMVWQNMDDTTMNKIGLNERRWKKR